MKIIQRSALIAIACLVGALPSFGDMVCVANTASPGECEVRPVAVPSSLTTVVSGGDVHLMRGWFYIASGTPTITIQDVTNSIVFVSFAGTAGQTYYLPYPALMSGGFKVQLTGSGTANFSVSFR